VIFPLCNQTLKLKSQKIRKKEKKCFIGLATGANPIKEEK